MHTDDAHSKHLPTGPTRAGRPRWLNGTVLGIGLASLFADWSHEIATTVMPAFLARMGVAAAWFGRGVRTPVGKALLAPAVTPETTRTV